MALAVAGCSDDDDPRTADTTPEASPTEASDPTSAPTTDSPSTTEPTAITPSPETAASTTDSTTAPTTAPVSPTDAAVAAFNALNEARHRCIADLQNCDPAAYAEFLSGEQLQSAIDQVIEAQANGYHTRNTDTLTETIEDVQASADDPTRIDITYCAEDGTVVVVPTSTGESVLNDRFSSNRVVAHLRHEADGRWRVFDYTRLGEVVTGEEHSICT
jgi:hypothetical protein